MYDVRDGRTGRSAGEFKCLSGSGQLIDVAVDGVEAEANRDDGEVRSPCLTPRGSLFGELAHPVCERHVVPAEILDRPLELMGPPAWSQNSAGPSPK